MPLQCTTEREIPPDDSLRLTIRVEVTSATGTVTNEASVEGGGAPTATTAEQTEIDAPTAPFGLQEFSFGATEPDGSPDTQAGSHPYEQTAGFNLTTFANPGE